MTECNANTVSCDNIRIVLVGTQHPGNIGSCARAMKTMGLSTLYLVNPHRFPAREAIALASGAADILENAEVVMCLDEALKGCALVVGASARIRHITLPLCSPEACAQKLVECSAQTQAALVFGREDSGLTNIELSLCQYQTKIPSVASFSSLNLAQAVQIFAYEIRKILQVQEQPSAMALLDEQAPIDEVEFFYEHLQQVLQLSDFFIHNNPQKMMLRLRRMFNRTHMSKRELNIVRGMLTAIEKKIAEYDQVPLP